MLIDFVFVAFIVSLVLFAIHRVLSKGFWRVLVQKFSFELSGQDKASTSWCPVVVKQKEKPSTLFIGVTRVGIVQNKLIISYLFPFNLFIKDVGVNVRHIGACRKRFLLGSSWVEITVHGIDCGRIFLPRKTGKLIFKAVNHYCKECE
ncbi:hypothetical protein [Marinobacter bohaiensis]|uniref:hypothetical protein n=1 Tax=Marinobacter bohaiensis TaxID=2201898 RepID=UPI0013A6A663|nr:hypothetical protein [Marinobacter bohaiensis]